VCLFNTFSPEYFHVQLCQCKSRLHIYSSLLIAVSYSSLVYLITATVKILLIIRIGLMRKLRKVTVDHMDVVSIETVLQWSCNH